MYLFSMCFFGANLFISTVLEDIKNPYSTAEEMAEYINNNLPTNETILIDASVIGQTMIPYLNTSRFYDISYESTVDCANVAYEPKRIIEALDSLDFSQYSNHYIIICNNFVTLDFPIMYETTTAMQNENYTLYYIP